MTRRDVINTFALVPVLPWLTLVGTKSPCVYPKTPGFFVRVRMEDGTQKIFKFPTASYATCETPTETE